MPLTSSPSFDGSADDNLFPDQPSLKRHPRASGLSSRLRLIGFSLAFLALLLALLAFVVPKYGAVGGVVRDLDGQPLQAEVYIEGILEPTQTDASGKFLISDVPSGPQVLTIRYRGSPNAFQIDIPATGSLNIGQIQIMTADS